MKENNVTLSEDVEVNDSETTKFNIEPKLHHDEDDEDDDENEDLDLNVINLNYKNKTRDNKLKYRICIGSICLLLLLAAALFAGVYLQGAVGLIGVPNSNDSINNNEYNIMDEIHIRSQVMREFRGNRTNEEECEARRCCDVRDGLIITDLPKGLNCTLLTDDECGDMDEYCEWDCDAPEYKSRKKGKIIRHFRRIQGSQGPYQTPTMFINNRSVPNNDTRESYQQCLDSTKMISSDDCGIEYDEELDPELADVFCRSPDEYQHEVSGDSGNGSLGNDTMDLGEDGPRRLYIFNPDDRFAIHAHHTYSFPYSAIVQVYYKNAGGVRQKCTGAMISSRWVLTAAHCIWGDGQFYTDFLVYKNIRDFNCNDQTIPGNEYYVDLVVVWGDYQTARPWTWMGEESEEDMGLLRLTTNPGTGYFGFGYDNNFAGTVWVNNLQHPCDKGCELWGGLCTITNWYPKYMASDTCSMDYGSSGAPVYRYDVGTRTIYGVVSAEAQDGAGKYWTDITRIDNAKYLDICSKVKVEDPQLC